MIREEAKSCICTIKMLQRLAYNIHGVMDVIDADNCKKIIKALEQEPCEDCISRQAVIEVLNKMDRYVADELTLCDTEKKFPKNEVFIVDDIYEQIAEQLPSVTPQPKTGHWIINEDEENAVHGHCSVCGWEAHYYEDDIIGMPYCPNCGAKMVEPQESEDKE